VVDPRCAGRVALRRNDRASVARLKSLRQGRKLEIDDEAKQIVQEIGTAINESVENSPKVAEAIERLRDAGYEMELTLRLEIGLRPQASDEEAEDEEKVLTLTDEDVQVLQRMKIRIDPED
jgi:hypothetical protein